MLAMIAKRARSRMHEMPEVEMPLMCGGDSRWPEEASFAGGMGT